MDKVKYLDTYALIEISKENASFSEYLNNSIIISDLTLVEFYGVLLREEGDLVADYWFRKFEGYSVQVSKEILIESVKFRHKNKTKNFSFFDAVGYIFALNNKIPFVTGDKEFKNMINVEFKRK